LIINELKPRHCKLVDVLLAEPVDVLLAELVDVLLAELVDVLLAELVEACPAEYSFWRANKKMIMMLLKGIDYQRIKTTSL